MPLRHSTAFDGTRSYHPYAEDYRREGSSLYTDFHPLNPRDPASYLQVASTLSWEGDRAGLSSVVSSYLANLGAPPESRNQGARLASGNAVAIVTAHQPGLFGGPLFLALKIISLLNLCDQLNSSQKEYHFVPVFWNGSEDHHDTEFGRVCFFDQEHDLQTFQLRKVSPDRMACCTGVEPAHELLAQLTELLPNTEFRAAVVQQLEESLDHDLGRSLSILMLTWFGARGLVVVEPHLFRAASVPILQRALSDAVHIHEGMAEDRRRMESRGYTPPLPLQEPDRSLVYRLGEDGVRRRICVDSANDLVLVEGIERRFRLSEMQSLLQSDPGGFGPCAALRPVVQAAVLPGVAYIAGGGEMAYHLQIIRLFHCFQLPLPLILPRASATLIKKSLVKSITRLNLRAEELLSREWGWDAVSREADLVSEDRSSAFSLFREGVHGQMAVLQSSLTALGHDKLGDLPREEDMFLKRINGIEKKLSALHPVEGGEARRQYFRLRKFLLPRESLQELSISTIYFLCLYGPGLFPEMAACIDPLSPSHHLFVLE